MKEINKLLVSVVLVILILLPDDEGTESCFQDNSSLPVPALWAVGGNSNKPQRNRRSLNEDKYIDGNVSYGPIRIKTEYHLNKYLELEEQYNLKRVLERAVRRIGVIFSGKCL